jgi:hypothetical protein
MSATDILMKAYDWMHFAERTGDAGKKWVQDYRTHTPKLEIGKTALHFMRDGRMKEGERCLAEFRVEVERVCTEPISIRAVLDRHRYGIEGYYFYCLRDFSKANQAMCLAHAAVHQARIARNQGRWREMQSYIAQARAMMCDRLPLCRTDDGREILWSNIGEFFSY